MELPEWFKAVRKTLSYIKMPGVYFRLRFATSAGAGPYPDFSAWDNAYWANVRGPIESELNLAISNELYPLGDGGAGNCHTLALSIRENDSRIFRYHHEDGPERYDWQVAFESYFDMLENVDALVLSDNILIEAKILNPDLK